MSEIYRFAGMELDCSRFQVRRSGKVLAVQPQVFDVLRYLVANHDRIVSKDELFDNVWAGRVVSEATLSSRIKAVRQLIGDTGKEQTLLLTLRHRGFRFVGAVEAELPDPRRILSATSGPDAHAAVGMTSASSGAASLDPPTSVAVLPFEMQGGDEPATDHVGQGVAADIIMLLARHRWLTVIARGSSFAVDARATPQQIGAILGVGYVLTGRIRWHDASGRVDAELTDCSSGRLLWNQNYSIERSSIQAVPEQIAQQISATIEPRLAQIEQQKTGRKRPEDFQAWDCCHRAFSHLFRFSVDDLRTAKSWFAKALEFDDRLARAHAGLAYASVQLAFYGPPALRDDELQQALSEAKTAIDIEPDDAFSRFAFGRTLCLLRRYPEAQAELEQAIELNHSFAQAWFALAFCFTVWDKPEAALPLYEKAVRLSPQDPHLWTFHHMRSFALFRLGRLVEAEDFVRAALRQPNVTYWPLATLCALLGEQGRIEEAKAVGERLRQMKPGYNLAYAKEDFFFVDAPEFVEQYLHNLALAY
ncbi:MAG: winged helix-turn-helix domain-containing protein [Rhodocyclaceae bacterium]